MKTMIKECVRYTFLIFVTVFVLTTSIRNQCSETLRNFTVACHLAGPRTLCFHAIHIIFNLARRYSVGESGESCIMSKLYQGELCQTYPIDGARDTTSRRGFPGAIFPCSVVWLGGRVSRWEPILCFFNVILKNELQENVCFGHLDVHEFERSP